MQQRLGVTAGLRQTLKHQITGRPVGHAGCEVVSHFFVERLTGVLLAHHPGHALKGFADMRFGDDTVVQPVGHVSAIDAQRGAVFHQADVVNVGQLGAASPKVFQPHVTKYRSLETPSNCVKHAICSPTSQGQPG